jgi:RecB family exonuclease
MPKPADWITWSDPDFLLCNSEGLKHFCAKIRSSRTLFKGTPSGGWKPFVVVAERKEDLVALRAQMHFLLGDSPAFGGVSMFTLDSLCQTLIAAFSLHSSWESPELESVLARPFFDVVTQEAVLRSVLLRLRFPARESLSVAKQILLLIDTPLPVETTLLQLLLEAEGSSSSLKRTPTSVALAQILAASQIANHAFQKVLRTQEFATECFPRILDEFVRNPSEIGKCLSTKFTDGDFLWVEAPSYCKENTTPYRPGNFPSQLVDILKSQFLILRQHGAAEHCENHCLQIPIKVESKVESTRPIQNAPESNNLFCHVEAKVVSPPSYFYQKALKLSNDPHTLCVLGDWDTAAAEACLIPGSFVTLHAEHVLAVLKETPQGAFWDATRSLLEEGLNHWELIEGMLPNVADIPREYGLPWLKECEKDRAEFCLAYCFQKSVALERSNLSEIPRALSLVASRNSPSSIVVLGRPHTHKPPSFNVKILNDVIFRLSQKGVPIELPASEVSYLGYYHSLCNKRIPTSFQISSWEDFQTFPHFISREKGVGLAWDNKAMNTLPGLLDLSPSTTPLDPVPRLYLQDQNWWKKKKDAQAQASEAQASLTQNSPQTPSISATSFEKYVRCPFRYYLENICGIQFEDTSTLNAPAKETGTLVHLVSERFLVFAKALRDENPKVFSFCLKDFVELFQKPEVLVHGQGSDLIAHILSRIDLHFGLPHPPYLKVLCQDFLDLIFPETSPASLHDHLTLQTARRCFSRLLFIECARLSDPENQTHLETWGGCLEQPFTFSWNGLEFRGKWDRIDTYRDGVEIIDYKTRKVPKKDIPLVLFPNLQDSKVRHELSIQGAVYAFAWANQKPEKPCLKFTLYRLKSLEGNPFLSVETPANFEQEFQEKYAPFASDLLKGNFPTRPLLPDECRQCSFANLCPIPPKMVPEEGLGDE